MKKMISLMRVMEKSKPMTATDWMIKIVIALAACGAAYFCGIKAVGIYQVMLADMISAAAFAKMVFAIFAAIVLCLSFVNIINMLYMSDDLLILMTMPFTELQLVGVVIANEIRKALLLSVFIVVPFNVAFGVKLGETAWFYIMIVITALALPIITICITSSVIMIIFRVFRIFRNRNFIRYFGIFLGILAYVIYICFFNGKNMKTDTIAAIGGFLGSSSVGSLWSMLILMAASIGIMAVLAKTIYIDTALRMKESLGKNQQMSVDALSKNNKRKHIIRSIMEKEIKMTLRTPAYLINGYLITFLFPVIIALFSLAEKGSLKDFSMASMVLESPEQLAMMLFITGVYTIFIAGSNSVGLTPVSREGNQLLLTRQMPIPVKTVMQGKVCAALFVCGIPTVGYMMIVGIVMVFLKKISWIYLIYGLIINMLILISVINMNTFLDMRKPVLDWSSEAAMLKEKGIAKLAWILAILLFAVIISIGILAASSTSSAMLNILIMQLVIAILSNLLVTKAGVKKLQ